MKDVLSIIKLAVFALLITVVGNLTTCAAHLALAEDDDPAFQQPVQTRQAPPAATSVDSDEANLLDPAQRSDNSFIYDTSIQALYDEPTIYDGQTVQIIGECIGDKITAEGNRNQCWIELSSSDAADSTSISVLMSAEQAGQIDLFGKYGVVGTSLQVRGMFHASCNDHEGLSDIHAVNVDVISKGQVYPDRFDFNDFLPPLCFIGIGLLLLVGFRMVQERQK